MNLLDALIKPLLGLESYNRLLNAIDVKNTPVLTTGVIDVQETHLVYAVSKHRNRPTLIIVQDELKAKSIYSDMSSFDSNVMLYPAKDIVFYSADVHSKDIDKSRFAVMDSLVKGEDPIVIMSIDALFDKIPLKKYFEEHVMTYKEGETIDIDSFCEDLIYMGYERTELVEGAGQFAIRGGIIDIYSPNEDMPVRIELWDEEIDSIRYIDVFSQRSVEKTDTIRIFPMRELVYNSEKLNKAIYAIEKDYIKALDKFEKNEMYKEAENLRERIGAIIEELKINKTTSSLSNFIEYFYNDTTNILNYISKNTIIFLLEPNRIAQHAKNVLDEFDESIKSRILNGYMLPSQSTMVFRYEEVLGMVGMFEQVIMSTLVSSPNDFKIRETISFEVKSSMSFKQHTDLFYEEIERLKKLNYKTVVLIGSQSRAQRLKNELFERGIVAAYVEDINNAKILDGTITITKGRLSKGFEYKYINFAVFTDRELYDESSNKKTRRKKKKSAPLESFTDLKLGDYVVHDNHGIGIFKGIEKIIVDGISKDYIKIEYSDKGGLFVPVNQMDAIQKYIGNGSAKVRLNKLGGQEWSKSKARVRDAVSILAEDLIELYAKRQAAKGYVYSKDNIWQNEFEESFPYEETDDQLNAIDDVKRDMQGGGVMDRLVCGDVGYGKTEVAIRAAFKAVQDGKQVAYLVPTTILAQQHYNTFCQRMMNYPIRIEMLSRFRSPKEQKETLKDIGSGFVDIVIGTHRLLSKDVKFKDIGLIIVDEEQRFGVGHKEKLKQIKENVDVLTLTATPIPRTLHMSLSGIRDMSILEEPPQERQVIQTYVIENNPEFVKEAINRELNRGGQVYYLHNRVSNIYEVVARIQTLVPNANIAHAHGRMGERELEIIMKDFIEGEIDVLVCTTIIETGLDIPNVNTIIIQDADRMGLSQLYQLRGRVGRSNKTSFAYLMYKKNKVLKEISEKRLQTIKEFTEFGSGFKIAMRDLEIRGAGNLLGAQQHGHMETVGYDMYCKLLSEAVSTLKGEVVAEEFETVMDINVNAYIPSFFIKNEEQRLDIYKRISHIKGIDDYYDVQEEIEDRYGNLPKSVQSLLEIMLIKTKAHSMGVLSVIQKQENIVVTFKADANINPASVTKLITEGKGRYLFTSSNTPYITIKMQEKDNLVVIDYIKTLLQELNPFK